jgi:predicted AlkP superfamily phosphohydrolase/phosphomutase
VSIRRRVLALAFDGANPELLQRWAAEGKLPNLARLIDNGVSGTSLGLEHFFVGSTWPSLYTGTSPAVHGHHSLVQLKPGSYESYELADKGLVRATPFWDILSRAGRRVAILDVPLSAVSPHLNGIQTVEWGSHDAVFGFRCSTPALQREIRAKYGEHPLGSSCDAANRGAADYNAFVARLIAGVERKAQLTRDVIAREPWDFAIQVFTESHCVGHQCWHLHDVQHLAHDRAIRGVTGDPLERVYSAIDAAIGDIIRGVGDDVTLIVFSAHGMSYWYGAQLLLPQILLKLGVAIGTTVKPAAADAGSITNAAAAVWRRLPSGIRRRLSPLRDRAVSGCRQAPSAVPLTIDAPRSRCFPVYNGLIEGGIRLNLRGREPNGVLEPGAAADGFCADLRRELLAITDERTGARLVREVVRTKDVVQGAALDALPDLLVLWSDAIATGSSVVGDGRGATIRVHSPRIGVVAGTNAFGRTGEHRPDGFCVAMGPGVARGRLPRDFSLLDYAPTFAALVGVEMHGSAGRVIDQSVQTK